MHSNVWIMVRVVADRLDVVHAAAIPMGAEPAATRCGEMIEQVRHRAAISSSRANAARQSHLLHATSMISRSSQFDKWCHTGESSANACNAEEKNVVLTCTTKARFKRA